VEVNADEVSAEEEDMDVVGDGGEVVLEVVVAMVSTVAEVETWKCQGVEGADQRTGVRGMRLI